MAAIADITSLKWGDKGNDINLVRFTNFVAESVEFCVLQSKGER